MKPSNWPTSVPLDRTRGMALIATILIWPDRITGGRYGSEGMAGPSETTDPDGVMALRLGMSRLIPRLFRQRPTSKNQEAIVGGGEVNRRAQGLDQVLVWGWTT